MPRTGIELWTTLKRPEFVYGGVICLLFVAGLSMLAGWSHSRKVPYAGQLVEHPVVNLVDYEVEDPQATERERVEARNSSALLLTPMVAYLDRLEASIDGLPRALAERKSLEEVNPELVSAFALTPETLAEVRTYIDADGATSSDWTKWSGRFTDLLWRKTPLLSAEDYQDFETTLNKAALIPPSTSGASETLQPIDSAMVMGEGEDHEANLRHELELLARQAGFPRDLTISIAQRVIEDPNPTAQIDRVRTRENAEQSASSVEPIKTFHERGEVIAMPGEVLDRPQILLIEQSRAAWADTAEARWERLLVLLGLGGISIGICALLTAYAATFYPRIAKNSLRLATTLGLVLTAAILTTFIGVEIPSLAVLAAVSTTLIVVIVIALTYDRRLALFIAITQSLLNGILLEESVGMVVALVITGATMAAMLREIRNRRALIRASSVTAAAGAIAFILPTLAAFPPSTEAWKMLLTDVASAVCASYFVGFLMLGALPSIEKMFGLTTGLTLSELRDTRHPLLRQMQQRAPGTYNHSLQIANIAEAAAEEIGADGLLVYVGALYHDIGKINKPDYFIENQAGGPNKHDKLSPAMSLLVITGHVKDGVELAKEYGLPRILIQFVESHHGTTLVEYFFHAAISEAEEKGEETTIEEFDFRYPGPKPRTREAAILMLCDCVESATRAMGEPTPSRIEALVRTLSRKRLEDGQFDECPLSFRELRSVEDSIIKSLCAIYHGRIAYPSRQSEDAEGKVEKRDVPQNATA